jgi:hypothetical protein
VISTVTLGSYVTSDAASGILVGAVQAERIAEAERHRTDKGEPVRPVDEAEGIGREEPAEGGAVERARMSTTPRAKSWGRPLKPYCAAICVSLKMAPLGLRIVGSP